MIPFQKLLFCLLHGENIICQRYAPGTECITNAGDLRHCQTDRLQFLRTAENICHRIVTEHLSRIHHQNFFRMPCHIFHAVRNQQNSRSGLIAVRLDLL